MRLLGSLAALLSLFVTTRAFAQNDSATPAGAPAAAPASATPSSASASAAPAAPALTDEDADAQGRLWIGFDLGGGVGTGASLSGPAFDGQFRAGWVMSHMMGAYGNLTALGWVAGGGSTSAGGANVSLGAVSGFLITPMFALTPVDVFEVSAGPSLDILSGGSASESVTNANGGSATVSVGGFSGAYFGIDGRVALHLGGRNAESHRRRGFTLSVDVHPSFVSGGPVTFITGGLGADWF